jgi:pimeloyl-ACP methyl ester carboxylesterase
MSASPAPLSTPEGPGSVSGAPNLPAGFTDTFISRYIDIGELRLHAVIGGEGPPLLLVHGWPQTWYAWRMLMPALAEDFQVIAVDQRGIGLSDKPQDGYDTATLASDLVALMAALLPPPLNARLWRLAFNQLPAEVNEQLVRGREAVFFGAEFDASAGTNKLPADAVSYYIDMLAADPDALRGSFEIYRAFPTIIAQDEQRKTRRLPMPVLAIGGEESSGAMVGDIMRLVADDVQTLVIPGCGHWVAEQAPEELLAALTPVPGPLPGRAGRGARPDANYRGLAVLPGLGSRPTTLSTHGSTRRRRCHDSAAAARHQAHLSRPRDHLRPRRVAGVSDRGPAADHVQRRRRPDRPGRSGPRGAQRRQRQRGRARHLRRREGQADPHLVE